MKKSLILFFIVFSFRAYAQTEHPIDKALQKCLDNPENQTTNGMITCNETAAAQWDKELNNYYSKLGKMLSADEKEKLKSSQLKWIEYRDKEFTFSDILHENLEGTMWLPLAAGRRADIVKARALELKSYHDLLLDAK